MAEVLRGGFFDRFIGRHCGGLNQSLQSLRQIFDDFLEAGVAHTDIRTRMLAFRFLEIVANLRVGQEGPVTPDRLGETEEIETVHVNEQFLDHHAVVDLRHLRFLHRTDEILVLHDTVAVAEFVVLEIIENLCHADKLLDIEVGGLAVIEPIGEDDSGFENETFFRGFHVHGAGCRDTQSAIKFLRLNSVAFAAIAHCNVDSPEEEVVIEGEVSFAVDKRNDFFDGFGIGDMLQKFKNLMVLETRQQF